MDFKEQLDSIKQRIDGFITKDTPTEQIQELSKLKDDIDGLGTSHQKTLDDYGELKELYIGVVKKTGSSDKPKDDITDVNGEVSLEKIGAEILAKGGK